MAVSVLNEVLDKQKNLKNEFDKISYNLNEQEKSFLKFLIYGVVRLKKTLDSVITLLFAGKMSNLNSQQKNILRIGIYQLKFMNSIPDYAAVSTSVDLAKGHSYKFSKVTNGVLNSYLRNKKDIKMNLDSNYNYSKSFIRNLKPYYNSKSIIALCESFNKFDSIWLRPIDNEINEKLHLFSNEIFKISNEISYFSINKINNFIRKALENNKVIVQSPGCGLAVKLLDIKPDEKVIDSCAAPGGKSHSILQDFKKNNILIANELNHSRNTILVNSLKKYKDNYDIIHTTRDASKESFSFSNKIFIDVPCSSSGTIKKNPDIKWKRLNLNFLNQIQINILENMSKYLYSNGAIVYSTCSIFMKENHSIIDQFILNNKDFKIDHAAKFIDEKFVDERGCLRICPYKDGLEGIFAVRLIRK